MQLYTTSSLYILLFIYKILLKFDILHTLVDISDTCQTSLSANFFSVFEEDHERKTPFIRKNKDNIKKLRSS